MSTERKQDKLKDNSFAPFLQNGCHALMMAAKNGHFDVVTVLLGQQVDVNIVDKVLTICGLTSIFTKKNSKHLSIKSLYLMFS
jgi:hypothetical protein